MKTLSVTIALALLTLASPARGTGPAKRPTHAKPEAAFINPDEIKWGAAPPELPKGGQLAVLHGDPSKRGTFTIRFKVPDGYKIPPHWHTQAEQLTIISGTLRFRIGDTMDAPAHDLQPGAYHYLPAKMHHSAEAKGETVVQIDGMGPFDIHYVNPADNPGRTSAAR
jgi:quercetin dioxygenase-like cupin family protein